MSNIKIFKDKDGNHIYPVTHASAVFDDEGHNILDVIKDLIDNDNNLPLVNVLDFGAKGNYNIDTGEGDDDTEALMLAHEYANANRMKVIYPSTGKAYKIASPNSIVIKTDVDFGSSVIYIDET